ncbi:hypothetical protein BV898_15754 [Hypsibius exemplaris]|uniref:Uncharacterized protein n=1 Tax=Hypsibius exemplaris TaxID=2072580 RepID=A0A9X6RKT7_HYPEX|nr:hypothetical protein BV898_15754 [Hypsibius exemplaris]
MGVGEFIPFTNSRDNDNGMYGPLADRACINEGSLGSIGDMTGMAMLVLGVEAVEVGRKLNNPVTSGWSVGGGAGMMSPLSCRFTIRFKTSGSGVSRVPVGWPGRRRDGDERRLETLRIQLYFDGHGPWNVENIVRQGHYLRTIL